MGARRDRRALALAATVAAIALGGALRHGMPDPQGRADARTDPVGHVEQMRRDEFDARFRQAVVMLHARQYEHAVTALHRALEISPAVPEAHVNMGFALLGLERHAAARDFFRGATELAPGQANAYYGLAIALDAMGDRPGARGAMRTYIHLTRADDPWLPRARAALWEWQSASAP
jgi:Flp pilus assembly protein TadD